mmetsp:Transcript_13194/g.20556  ORF Transcript_13194/g.20556 Transcript_13194/m.20556 type:complete len:83 (-) Transcript_13194:180-428(-)|eukprot:CAMPEP_0170503976 /NCGR_PEP_ID=MMETSP0208-20121228/46486_1 /TAXON_ID=197538 /ORGANISM="Strombidium inclinatum, Strain S3" /LENGTH=82 /DNA_ID=CAMNT_0010783943 /DNA_START=243 /DNA_END=491 /DNA_ORIENTATION=-
MVNGYFFGKRIVTVTFPESKDKPTSMSITPVKPLIASAYKKAAEVENLEDLMKVKNPTSLVKNEGSRAGYVFASNTVKLFTF